MIKRILEALFYIIIGMIIGLTPVFADTLLKALDVRYDNTNSNLTATNVQDIIDELNEKANQKIAEAKAECPEGYTCTPPPPYSIVADANSNGVADIGDEIVLTGTEEHFYVISNDGTTISALAKYNLNVGSNANSTVTLGIQHESVKGYVSSGTQYGNVAFSNTYGWSYSNNDTIDIQAYDGPVKTALNAYKEILPEGIEVRLITKAELEGLGCSSSSYSCSGAPSWVYSTSYWSGSANANDDYDVWSVRSDGDFYDYSFYSGYYFGVRPVISLES